MNNGKKRETTCINVKGNTKLISFAVSLIASEWGGENAISKIEEKMKNEQNKSCFVLADKHMLIGCFVICYDDIKQYPLCVPQLACVCIDKRHRNKGYSYELLKWVDKKIKENGEKVCYLKTTLEEFYEKHDWEYIESFFEDGKKEKLYKKNINGR